MYNYQYAKYLHHGCAETLATALDQKLVVHPPKNEILICVYCRGVIRGVPCTLQEDAAAETRLANDTLILYKMKNSYASGEYTATFRRAKMDELD